MSASTASVVGHLERLDAQLLTSDDLQVQAQRKGKVPSRLRAPHAGQSPSATTSSSRSSAPSAEMP